MVSLPIHDATGQPTGRNYEFDLGELAAEVNKQLLHDAVVMYEANRRQGTFKSKSRAEIAGCSKKLYKQKGTGNARAGNKRTPVRRGGGHAFAKRPTDYSYSMPRKALRLATRMALLSKFRDNEVIVIDGLSFDKPKTRAVYSLLKRLQIVARPKVEVGGKPARRPADESVLIATEQHDPNVYKSARNIPDVSVSPAADLNAYQLLKRKRLVVTTGALDRIRGKAGA
uniref:Large ribosomal subunit protein uL4 n=1 Tax=Schlesneria paludicola TaxID=360056 RepID=A0A7C2NXT3_9PLAN